MHNHWEEEQPSSMDVLIQRRARGLYMIRPERHLHDLPLNFDIREGSDFLSEHIPLGETRMIRLQSNGFARLLAPNGEIAPEGIAQFADFDVALLFQEQAKAEGRWIELDPLAPAPF